MSPDPRRGRSARYLLQLENIHLKVVNIRIWMRMRMIYLAKIKITEIEERNRIEDQPERIMMEEEHDPER